MIVRWLIFGLLVHLFFVRANAQTSHFRFTSNTGENATVGIPLTANPRINGAALVAGDEIGAFTPGGLCVGAIVWQGTGAALTVWGDNSQTPDTVDGMLAGEVIHYRVWQRSSDTEFSVVAVSYSQGNGIYSANGLHVMGSLVATAPPDPPALKSPPDSAMGVEISPAFEWFRSPFAQSYHIQVSSEQDFSIVNVDQSGVTDTVYAAAMLDGNRRYYWRVRASNAAGSGTFTSPRTFTTAVLPPTVPLPASPANGSIDLPTTLELKWNASDGATFYHLQVSGDSSFTTALVSDSLLIASSRQVGPLANATMFFWRVRAKNDGGVSPWSPVWRFTTVPIPPPVPTQTAPSNGAREQETSLILRWRTAPRSVIYHLQLSTGSSFSSIAFQDSAITDTLRLVEALMDNVTYYWRVRAGNSGGWSGYSTAWNFTTKSLNAPFAETNAATDITATSATLRGTVNPRGLTTTVKFGYGTTPALGNSVDAAENPVSGTSPVSVTNALRGLKPNTRYFFSVGAFNSAGTTRGDTLEFITDYAVAAPSLVSPVNGAVDQPTSILLVWRRSVGATSYSVQVALDSVFASIAFRDTMVTDTSRQVGALARNTAYFWRVQARNSAGSSPWSEVWRFRTLPPPPQAPLLFSPSNGVSEQPLTVPLVWRRSAGADSYRVQLSTSSAFTTALFDSSLIPDTTVTVRNLSNNVTYYWRARAANIGGTSEWSSVWRFTTFLPVPSTPRLVSPENGSGDIPNPVTLMWTRPAYAEFYRIQVSTDSSFSAVVIDDSLLSSTTTRVSLQPATTYYWRVRAWNEAGSSGWTSPWNFTTARPLMFHSIALARGWNMASTYIQPGNSALDSLCRGIRSNMVLMKNGAGDTYVPEYGINTIGNWQVRHGYKIYMAADDTLMIGGSEVLPQSTGIMTVGGWNMVSYLRNSSLDVESALASINQTLVLAKDNSGNTYVPRYGINQIGFMRPGQGYKMYLSQSDTLVYPANGNSSTSTISPTINADALKSDSQVRRDTVRYFRFTSNTGNNASVIIPVSSNPNVNGMPLSDGDEIAAFTRDGLCVGAVVWNGSNTALTIWGDDDQTQETDGIRAGERIYYRVWLAATGREIDSVSVSYSQGDGVYSPDGIYVLSSFAGQRTTGVRDKQLIPTEFELYQNWPNPFNPGTLISFGLPTTSRVRLEVFNIIGQSVSVLVDGVIPPGYHHASFSGEHLPGGVYLCRLAAGDLVLIRKMILLR